MVLELLMITLFFAENKEKLQDILDISIQVKLQDILDVGM